MQIFHCPGGGRVAEEALSIALYCAMLCKSEWEIGIRMAVNHDSDSDSTGILDGNILGLINGILAFPQNWIKNLRFRDIVQETSKRLLRIDYESAWYIEQDLLCVSNDDYYGVINLSGDIVVPCKYDDIGYFKEGLCEIEKNGKYGFIDI